MYKAIIWDLDGTLLDSSRGVVYAVKYTIKELGLEMPGENTIREFVGPPMQLSFEKYFKMEKKDALEAANKFRFYYKTHSLFMADLYPETLNTLKYLKANGYKMAVATNKSHDNAINILRHFGISEYCDYMMGTDLEGKLKKADIIERCLKELQISSDEAVYIGDSLFDLEGAEKTGMDFIGVTYGFGFREGGLLDYKMISSIIEIKNIL